MNETLVLVLAILSSSFFGSWHYAAMCGPIASLMGAKHNLFSYHAGRFLSYTLLGVLAGGLGQYFLENTIPALRTGSAILLSLTLLITGLRLIFPRLTLVFPYSAGISHLLIKAQSRWSFRATQSGAIVGFLTALLPCGWLYTYAVAAAVSKSPWAGAMTMGLFWLGGLPALSAAPTLIRKGIESAGLAQQRIAGGILVGASLYAILSFFFLHS
jgi:sulfite exporter TauE/SafE